MGAPAHRCKDLLRRKRLTAPFLHFQLHEPLSGMLETHDLAKFFWAADGQSHAIFGIGSTRDTVLHDLIARDRDLGAISCVESALDSGCGWYRRFGSF